MAIWRAAAITESRSGSRAPRSMASSSARVTSKGMRNSTSGWTRRRRACTSGPLAGEEMGSARPSSTSESSQPSGPRKSTTRRPASMPRRVRLASFSISSQPASVIGARSRKRWFFICALSALAFADRRLPMPRLPSPLGPPSSALAAAFVHRRLDAGDRALGEQERLEMLRQGRIAAAQPFQRHRRVLLLLVAIVLEDGAQLGIARRLGALVVPVDGLELLHQRDDGAVLVDDFRAELAGVFVQRFTRHAVALHRAGEH